MTNNQSAVLPVNHEKIVQFISNPIKSSINNEIQPNAFIIYGNQGCGKTYWAQKLASFADIKYYYGCNEVDSVKDLHYGSISSYGIMEIEEIASPRTDFKQLFIFDDVEWYDPNQIKTFIRVFFEILANNQKKHTDSKGNTTVINNIVLICTNDLDKIPHLIDKKCFHVRFNDYPKEAIVDMILGVGYKEQFQENKAILLEIIKKTKGNINLAIKKYLTVINTDRIYEGVDGLKNKDEIILELNRKQ